MVKGVHRTQEEKNAIIKQWRESGKSMGAWCRETNILPETTLYGWIKPKKPKSSLRLSHKSFTELKSPSQETGIKIECAGVHIYLSRDFDALELKRCLKVLRGNLC
jgi:transposase-like protein